MKERSGCGVGVGVCVGAVEWQIVLKLFEMIGNSFQFQDFT